MVVCRGSELVGIGLRTGIEKTVEFLKRCCVMELVTPCLG
jgi:hypothetical protein